MIFWCWLLKFLYWGGFERNKIKKKSRRKATEKRLRFVLPWATVPVKWLSTWEMYREAHQIQRLTLKERINSNSRVKKKQILHIILLSTHRQPFSFWSFIVIVIVVGLVNSSVFESHLWAITFNFQLISAPLTSLRRLLS